MLCFLYKVLQDYCRGFVQDNPTTKLIIPDAIKQSVTSNQSKL